MPDITIISTLLAGIKTAFDIAQTLRTTDISLEKADLKLKLAELIDALADAKIGITEINSLVHKKDQEIAKLKDALKLKSNLVRKKGAYFETDENGQARGDPYCSHCWETEHIAVHIHQNPELHRIMECPHCKSEFRYVKSYSTGEDD
jgi:hypothetical protein